MDVLDAAVLGDLVNGYSLDPGTPRKISIPNASKLAALRDVTVSGILLHKQFAQLDPASNQRTYTQGTYRVSSDGDLHFCLGTADGRPHIPCELQNARAFVQTFTQAIGEPISVSGFFRCLFEHPGFSANDDAHLFEVHPVRAVALAGGAIQAFGVDKPDPASIHSWVAPHNLSDQDGRITVDYQSSTDTLVFAGMDGMDENYIQIQGTISDIRDDPSTVAPAEFTFTADPIGHDINVVALEGTNAIGELRQIGATAVTMVGLRNIDLQAALQGQYMINMLAIDLQQA
jgi:hypothetical protein